VPDFPRAARWEALTVLLQLAGSAGVRLADEGACRGGQIGAHCVSWPDGHRSVLTVRPAGQLAEARRAAALAATARAAGVPAPLTELIADLPAGTAVVQELLPGAFPSAMSRRTAEDMVAVNRRCRGLLAGRPEFPAPSLFLLSDGPGFCLHEPVAGYSRRTARLLAAIEEAGAAVPEHLEGDDLVHFDFHPENVLVDPSGAVTGVIDWDGASRSNGVFDLFTLRFDLAYRAPDLGRWVDGLLREEAGDELWLACWAHMSLRLVDWSIREIGPEAVAIWLDVAEELRPE
jgi:Phosphotransferase enzyme family